MTIFAISDLHLPAREKPMDIFGAHWENHFERISEESHKFLLIGVLVGRDYCLGNHIASSVDNAEFGALSAYINTNYIVFYTNVHLID